MDINTVTQGLNDICEEVGVCPKLTNYPSLLTKKGNPLTKDRENITNEAKIIYAAELRQDGSKKVVRVGCYSDGIVTSCLLEEGKMPAPCCHSSESGGMTLTKAWVEHLKSNGYRVKEIPVEE